jgi:hypothetical protein
LVLRARAWLSPAGSWNGAALQLRRRVKNIFARHFAGFFENLAEVFGPCTADSLRVGLRAGFVCPVRGPARERCGLRAGFVFAEAAAF